MATGAILRKEGQGSGTYSYSSQPRVVEQSAKYRETDARPSNIMYDRRIVRGNTYALHSLPASTQPNPLELQRQQESKRRVMARKRINEHLRIRSPPPVDGRKHIDIQTELYLEEITDRVEESDVFTQTDAFLDRPPTPLFIPAKTGMDVATQIEDGDLFDFDLEVKPILEVLVGKTVEQALLEVMEEEELSSLREQQRIFEENRNAELVETQRLEEQERRNREEKERRMMQQRSALLKEKETAEKVSARAFAQSYLSDLVPAVFSRLSDGGFFYDPVEREIETMFMPWLMKETDKIVNKQVVARQLLDVILRDLMMRKLGMNEPRTSDSTKEHPVDGEETKMATLEKTEEVKDELIQEKEETNGEKMEEDGKTMKETTEQERSTDDQSEKPSTEVPATGETETDESKLETEKKKETEAEEPKETIPMTEETKPEEPNKEETVTEELKDDLPKEDEPTTVEPNNEIPKSEEPKLEEVKEDVPKPEEPKLKEEDVPNPEETKPEKEDIPKPEEPKPEEELKEEVPMPEEPKLEEEDVPKPEEPKPEDELKEEVPTPEEPKEEEEKSESEKPQDDTDAQ